MHEDILAYDLETTGTNVRLDQALQFGAIRARLDGTPIEETELRIRRLPYVIPHPKAVEVTGVDLASLDDPSRLSEFEAAERIRDVIAPAPGNERIVVTFNGMRYDNELVRTMLFRNLLDPYYGGFGTIRNVDVFSAVRLALAMRPGCIATLVNDEGRPSLKLEDLCEANGIRIGAHDAVEDVRGTLAILDLVRREAPSAWTVARRSGLKKTVEECLKKRAETAYPIWLFRQFSEPECRPYLVLRRLPNRSWLAADLTAEVHDIKAALLDLGKRLYEKDGPLKEIKPNKCPYLLSGDEAATIAPPREAGGRWIDPERAKFKASALASGLADLRIGAVPGFVRDFSDPTSEESIYDGFPDTDDKTRMRVFRQLSDWKERSDIGFDDHRIRDFGARILLMTAGPRERERYAGKLGYLAEVAREAMGRHLATGDRRWTTIETGNIAGDAAFRRWTAGLRGAPSEASSAVPAQPAPLPSPDRELPAPPRVRRSSRKPDPGQMAFGF